MSMCKDGLNHQGLEHDFIADLVLQRFIPLPTEEFTAGPSTHTRAQFHKGLQVSHQRR